MKFSPPCRAYQTLGEKQTGWSTRIFIRGSCWPVSSPLERYTHRYRLALENLSRPIVYRSTKRYRTYSTEVTSSSEQSPASSHCALGRLRPRARLEYQKLLFLSIVFFVFLQEFLICFLCILPVVQQAHFLPQIKGFSLPAAHGKRDAWAPLLLLYQCFANLLSHRKAARRSACSQSSCRRSSRCRPSPSHRFQRP